jgi:hypothetical protein
MLTYISHEFLARNANLLCQGGREHHDLLVVGSCPENLLNVAAHVWWAMSQSDDLVAKQLQGEKEERK